MSHGPFFYFIMPVISMAGFLLLLQGFVEAVGLIRNRKRPVVMVEEFVEQPHDALSEKHEKLKTEAAPKPRRGLRFEGVGEDGRIHLYKWIPDPFDSGCMVKLDITSQVADREKMSPPATYMQQRDWAIRTLETCSPVHTAIGDEVRRAHRMTVIAGAVDQVLKNKRTPKYSLDGPVPSPRRAKPVKRPVRRRKK